MITLYIVGVLLSDIINDSQALLLYRGLAKPLAIFLSFFIYVFGLAVHPRGLVSFVHGLLIGAIIFFFVGSDFQETTANYNFAVFRYTPIFVSFSAVVGYYIYREVRSPQLIVAFLYLTLTILSAKIMNRSFMLVMFTVTVSFVLMYLLKKQGYAHIRLNLRHYVLIGGSLFLTLSVISALYIYMAPRSMLGEYQMRKFYMQSDTVFGATPWGILLSGRHQLLANILVIKDHFLFGLGSWPFYGEYLLEAVSLLGIAPEDDKITRLMVESQSVGHSILLGSWSQNGLCAGIFWLFVLWLNFKLFLDIFTKETVYTPILIRLCVGFFWSVMFTPLSPLDRQYTGLLLALYVLFLSKHSLLAKRRIEYELSLK